MTDNLKTFLMELKKLQDQYDVKFVVMPKGVIEVRDNSATVCFNRTIVPSQINTELKKLKDVVNTDYNVRTIEAKKPTDIKCQFSLSDFKKINGLCYTWNNEHTDKNNFIQFECVREKKYVYVQLLHCYDNGESAEFLDRRQYDIDTDKTLKIKVVKKKDSEWYELDVTEIEPEPKSNEEILDEVFKEMDELGEQKKEFLKTDPAPWLTKTYSKQDKQEYQHIRGHIYDMNTNEMYKHLSENNLWSRAIREEMNRRSKTPSKKPKNPGHEYYEPETCPWCGVDIKKDDGNYRCHECGYDHLLERNHYIWKKG